MKLADPECIHFDLCLLTTLSDLLLYWLLGWIELNGKLHTPNHNLGAHSLIGCSITTSYLKDTVDEYLNVLSMFAPQGET